MGLPSYACRDAAAEYGIPDLSGASIAAALSDAGSRTAMLVLLHPKRDLDVRAAAAGALRLSLGAPSSAGRQSAAVAPPLSLRIAEVRPMSSVGRAGFRQQRDPIANAVIVPAL